MAIKPNSPGDKDVAQCQYQYKESRKWNQDRNIYKPVCHVVVVNIGVNLQLMNN